MFIYVYLTTLTVAKKVQYYTYLDNLICAVQIIFVDSSSLL